MSSRTNDKLKTVLLGTLGVIGITVVLILSYIKNNNISWENLEDFDVQINENQSISESEIEEVYREGTFPVKPALRLALAGDTLEFVYEDREDIMIVYDRSWYGNDSYDIDYKARVVGEVIDVKVDFDFQDLVMDNDVYGAMTIYLPMDYQCERLIVTNPYGDGSIDLPRDLDTLDYTLNFGELDLSIDQPLQSADITVNAGTLSVDVNDLMEELSLVVNTGELDLDLNARVDQVKVENNIGETEVKAAVSPLDLDVHSNMGDLTLTFEQPIRHAKAGLNMGDLEVFVAEDEKGLVFIGNNIIEHESVLGKTSHKDGSVNLVSEKEG